MQGKIDEIWELLKKPNRDNFSKALEDFTELINNKTYRKYMGKITPLNARYEDHKENWGVLTNVDDERGKIIRDFTEILQKFEDEYSPCSDTQSTGTYNKSHNDLDLLYKFDFNEQTKCFDGVVIGEKPVTVFVVRGEEHYGRDWLYNRLVHDYVTNLTAKGKAVHPPLVLDMESVGETFKEKIDTATLQISGKITSGHTIFVINNLFK